MASITAILKDFRVRLLLLFILIASIIWFIGPYLVFGEFHPLNTPNQRLTTLLIVSILWGIGYWYATTLQTLRISTQQNALIFNEIKRWQYYFKLAILTSEHKWYHSIAGMPQKNWFLMIGPKGVGKSTLLKTTQAELHDEEYLTPKPITNTKSSDFWFYPNAVIMELFSEFFDTNNSIPLELYAAEIIKSIKNSGVNFRGILLTVDALSIFQEDKEPVSEVNRIHLFLEKILQHFPKIPIQLLILKSDQISGFIEFFDDMGPEERIQSCGLSLANEKADLSLPEIYDTEFDTFLSRINDRLIWRLHQEHDQDNRNLIKDFPIQVAMLKAQLAHIMNAILPHTDINLQSINFTSCQQQSAPVNNILPVIGQSFNLPMIAPIYQAHSQKVFFVKMLMQRLLDDNVRVDKAIYSNRPKYLAISGVTVFSLILSMSYAYFHSNNLHIQNAKLILTKINLRQQNQNLHHLLEKLIVLELATKELSTKEEGMQNLNSTNKRLASRTAGTFIQVLHSELFPLLVDTTSKTIEQYTALNDKEHLTELYDALKIYLMLTQPQYLKKEDVLAWINQNWGKEFEPKQLQALNKYTELLFVNPLPIKQPNTKLVTNARKLLTDMSQENLILSMINSDKNSQLVPIIISKNPTLLSEEHNYIPAKYTSEQFFTLFHKLIPEAAEKISQGDWVLGENTLFKKDNKHGSAELIALTQKHYLEDYRKAWEIVLQNIQLPEVRNLDSFLVAMNDINEDDSQMIQFFRILKTNTSRLSSESIFNHIVSKHFESINSFNLDNPSSTTYLALNTLAAYVNTISNSKTPDVASFSAAKKRMAKATESDPIDNLIRFTRTMPEPLKTWSLNVASTTWKEILNGATNHIQNAWTTLVLPEYESNIFDRFPVFQDSKQDITLNEFTTFFGPRGIIDLFFSGYLAPFVNTQNYAYQWKEVNGQKLNFDTATLDIFIRAVLIQKMFFAGADNKIGVNFSLIPLGINPNIKDFSLNIYGQNIDYKTQTENSSILIWPGSTPDGVSLKFISNSDRPTEVNYKGDWGWFKLLKDAKVVTTNNAKELSVSFNYADSKIADFKLSTTNVINPFLPNILNSFRCPEKLG